MSYKIVLWRVCWFDQTQVSSQQNSGSIYMEALLLDLHILDNEGLILFVGFVVFWLSDSLLPEVPDLLEEFEIKLK